MRSGAITVKGNRDKGELFSIGDINIRVTRRVRDDPPLSLFLQDKTEGFVLLLPSGPLLPNFFSNNPYFAIHDTFSH